jgi:tonB-linked outer membrane protein, susC/ragA family
MRRPRFQTGAFLLRGFLTLSLLFASANGAWAQIKLTTQKAHLETVIEKIKKQSKYRFFYSDALAKASVNAVEVDNASITDVLDRLFSGTAITYRLVDNVVYLSDKNAPAQKKEQRAEQQKAKGGQHTVTGVVKDSHGEPLIGVSVLVKGTGKGAVTNIDGQYTISTDMAKPVLVYSYVGYTQQEQTVNNRSVIDVVMKDDSQVLGEVVVTAMGILRKQESLTYATQKIKAEDLVKVQDPNVANTLEGKVSGITITPSAGGAGGASKIILRGNKSVSGNSAPLIVVDGVPMSNKTRGQASFNQGEELTFGSVGEGSDPLSMINPDDIESINVLKGSNAAALYGSQAANGVVMITTKSGREGKIDIGFTSNVTFDAPLLTPKIQNIYGATMEDGAVINGKQTTQLGFNGWGGKISEQTNLSPLTALGNWFPKDALNEVHLRNTARNDVNDFFRTGVTTNNSVSVSGGNEKSRSYLSLGNSYATGMVRNNSYNRNSLMFRQNLKLFDRLKIDASINYVETITRNRPGGGTVGNPIYHTYLTPRNVDMQYYKNHYMDANGSWMSGLQDYYKEFTYIGSDGKPKTGLQPAKEEYELHGPMQSWAYKSNDSNNPYWLLNMSRNRQDENRLFTTLSAAVDIYDGLSFQARFNYTRTHYKKEGWEHATTLVATAAMNRFGRCWSNDSKSSEIYTDYLLSYNKTLKDYSLSATAGWVGHTLKETHKNTYIGKATVRDENWLTLPKVTNYFEVNAGGPGVTTSSIFRNWDKAWLFTAQVGWKEKVYVDGSYRLDSYRPFRQFYKRGMLDREWFGYFGVGANAIVSSLVKLPTWIDYLKYRVSYSEVGNSIPENYYFKFGYDLLTGAGVGSKFSKFKPVPEKMRSFETGVEMLFFKNRLSVDFTYYNTRLTNMYMQTSSGFNVNNVYNTGIVRNTGFESTVGYDFKFGKHLRWRTAYNFSFNSNKILRGAIDENGNEREISVKVGGAHVLYSSGRSLGDIYVPDFKYKKDGKSISVTKKGVPRFDDSQENLKYVGNMNSKWQMGWTNTFNYKDFSLTMLINGRIGGKVISLTESYLDFYGLSKRTADARQAAERNGIVASAYGNVPGIALPDGSGRIVPVKEYFEGVGSSASTNANYVYSATNFRLRELSLGYTFRDLFGLNKNLNVSFIARNLFFLYKKSPVDPDVSLSTANGLGGFEVFNTPSSRSYGLSFKINL